MELEYPLNLAMSFIGGIVEQDFDTVFGASSLGGLYDRFLLDERRMVSSGTTSRALFHRVSIMLDGIFGQYKLTALYSRLSNTGTGRVQV